MGYTEKEGMVRVDLFKDNGKWYTTISLDMSECYDKPFLIEVTKEILLKHIGNSFQGMLAVILEPYHKNAHPLMIRIPQTMDLGI